MTGVGDMPAWFRVVLEVPGEGPGCWPRCQDLPTDEWRSVDALLRSLDFHGGELAEIERDIAIEAIDDPVVTRLMTVRGIDAAVAIAVVAAVRAFTRFESPDRLVASLGLNPQVRQSGNSPAVHGRISKARPAQEATRW